MARGNVFQEVRPGVGFKTGDLVIKNKLGGATVERLIYIDYRPYVYIAVPHTACKILILNEESIRHDSWRSVF